MGGPPQFAQSKSHTQKANRIGIKFLTHCKRSKPTDNIGRFPHFYVWLFRRARPLCRTLVRRRLVDHVFCIELHPFPLAQNKSHYEKQSKSFGILNIYFEVEIRIICGFLHFLCGFLAALDLSAVPLYGDDCSITSSASNRLCPHFLPSRRTKATHLIKSNSLEFQTYIFEIEILHFPLPYGRIFLFPLAFPHRNML